MNSLDSWLRSKKYLTASEEVKTPSHLSYDSYNNGGKIYIPRSEEYEFIRRYANELDKGTKLYYVEKRPKTYKFMVDLDISDDHYWSKEEIIELSMVIHEVVSEFYNSKHAVICCISPAKMKNEEIHTGIHLIWPSLVVISDTALILREGILQKLGTMVEKFNFKKELENIIDDTIYTRNGFRMVGSDKMCRKKIPENRELSLLFVLDQDNEISELYYERLKRNTVSLISETSIRYVMEVFMDTSMFIDKYPKWFKSEKLESLSVSGISDVVTTIVDNDIHTLIENFIEKNFPEHYQYGLKVAVSRYEDGNLLIKTNSKYCLNIGRNHNSCGIYFFAYPGGMYQMCLCPCNKLDGRKNGLCMDYRSECVSFDESVLSKLFSRDHIDRYILSKTRKEVDIESIKSMVKGTYRRSTEESISVLFQTQKTIKNVNQKKKKKDNSDINRSLCKTGKIR